MAQIHGELEHHQALELLSNQRVDLLEELNILEMDDYLQVPPNTLDLNVVDLLDLLELLLAPLLEDAEEVIEFHIDVWTPSFRLPQQHNDPPLALPEDHVLDDLLELLLLHVLPQGPDDDVVLPPDHEEVLLSQEGLDVGGVDDEFVPLLQGEVVQVLAAREELVLDETHVAGVLAFYLDVPVLALEGGAFVGLLNHSDVLGVDLEEEVLDAAQGGEDVSGVGVLVELGSGSRGILPVLLLQIRLKVRQILARLIRPIARLFLGHLCLLHNEPLPLSLLRLQESIILLLIPLIHPKSNLDLLVIALSPENVRDHQQPSGRLLLAPQHLAGVLGFVSFHPYNPSLIN